MEKLTDVQVATAALSRVYSQSSEIMQLILQGCNVALGVGGDFYDVVLAAYSEKIWLSARKRLRELAESVDRVMGQRGKGRGKGKGKCNSSPLSLSLSLSLLG